MPRDSLAASISSFFEQHLVAQRGLSTHTVIAYRDTWKLFLEFACQRHRKRVTSLILEEITADIVRRFLDHLENVRKNSIPTRNVRLAAIHAFFNYLAAIDPRYLAQAQEVLAVPFKRRAYRVPDYLQREELLQVFAQIDSRTALGERDDALLRLLYNTGMRVQELVDLNANQVRFGRPYQVRICGKGRKERTCPLWNETVVALKSYLKSRGVAFGDTDPLFTNEDGNRLTRFGIRHIVSRRVADATSTCPSLLARRITPHTIRHTTAMHLLQSNVDLSMIRSWLGHASIETTNGYVEIDLEMKRKTLQACEKLIPKQRKHRSDWRGEKDILSWLSKL